MVQTPTCIPGKNVREAIERPGTEVKTYCCLYISSMVLKVVGFFLVILE